MGIARIVQIDVGNLRYWLRNHFATSPNSHYFDDTEMKQASGATRTPPLWGVEGYQRSGLLGYLWPVSAPSRGAQ